LINAVNRSLTVRDLIKLLSEVEDQDRIVILQKYPKRNACSPLVGLRNNTVYKPDTFWEGVVKVQDLTKKLGNEIPCIVLFPIN